MESVNRKYEIGNQVDSWIAEEELPPRANYKVKKGFDPYTGIEEYGIEAMDEDEIQAYKEFVGWFVNKDMDLLNIIPKTDFGFSIGPEHDGAISYAFGSMDFRRLLPEFNKYNYKLKIIFDKVKTLAETHSILSNQDGKEHVEKMYKEEVEVEFRETAKQLLKDINNPKVWVDKLVAMKKIAYANYNIKKCKDIWAKYANLT